MNHAVTLFHVSDIHFGAEDRAALDWFASEVARHRPDAVICTGDLTMRGTRRQLAEAGEWLGGLGVPVSVEAGNHDMPYYWEPLSRLRQPLARFLAIRRQVHSELAVDGVALVSLKTVSRAQLRLNWSKGCVRPAALARTLARLHGTGEAGLRLVACHHPLVEADTQGTASTRGGKQALAALARAGAHVVLSGHVHDPFDKLVEIEGRVMRLIGAGTLSQRVRVTRPSYNRLDWSPQQELAVAVQAMD